MEALKVYALITASIIGPFIPVAILQHYRP
jgi:hypothetical protein